MLPIFAQFQYLMMEKMLKVAILDMNAGKPNQGMRCIIDIVSDYCCDVEFTVFDVRTKNEIPGLNFDIYISSGGPGNPLEGDGIWDKAWYDLVDALWSYNNTPSNRIKKHVFFICHSFQMACNHFELGTITRRKSTSFGVMPIHKTDEGFEDILYRNLPDPHYAVDSRDYQLVQPDLDVFAQHGAKILALEKIRTHVEYERAIMAVRFSPEMVGTQYHPEADPEGMKIHFEKEENRNTVINNFSIEKYVNMMESLDDKDKITLTHTTILPSFLDNAICTIRSQSHKKVEVL